MIQNPQDNSDIRQKSNHSLPRWTMPKLLHKFHQHLFTVF